MKRIIRIAARECRIIVSNPIFLFCMVLFPVFVVFFFTSFIEEGVPEELPVGIVDQDNTATTRKLTRMLDSFQTSHVVAHYPTMSEAREAMQRGDIYAFLYFPKGTTEKLIGERQPKVSFYYNGVVMLAGNTTFKDLKTVATLGSAGVGAAKLSALGKTSREVKEFLQPITIDLHQIGNPWSSYNIYLTTTMAAGAIMIFIFLLTPYSIGTELKFGRAKEWMKMADGNPYLALAGKMLPHTLVFLAVFYGFEFYIYYVLHFPHPGGIVPILLVGLLSVLSAQGFGIFFFGLMPSLRMSMSISSLWAVVSITASGATYPIFAMDGFLEAVAQLFPLRHYYMLYQACIFNGYPLGYLWTHVLILVLFSLLPMFVIKKIKRAMIEYVYIP